MKKVKIKLFKLKICFCTRFEKLENRKTRRTSFAICKCLCGLSQSCFLYILCSNLQSYKKKKKRKINFENIEL